MSNENTTNGTETPAPVAAPKVMDTIRAKFQAAGGTYKDGKPVPTTAQLKAAKAASKELTDSLKLAETAEKAAADAREKVYVASAKIMEATGAVGVTIGGRELIPMAKGDKVYFRSAGQRTSVDLG